MNKLSIIQPTGYIESGWPGHLNLTQGASGLLSSAGWTKGNEGFIQQTFLGASIRNFNLTAGFGTTTSSLSVELVEDEYNKSDGTGLGLGDDVYHNGQYDRFSPPAVGSPVFFKFGKNFATTEQAWRSTFDKIYEKNTLPATSGDVVELSEFPIPLPSNNYLDLDQSEFGYYADSGKYVFIDNSKNGDPDGYYGDVYETGSSGIPDSGNTYAARGADHIVFGGILQSFVENKGTNGNSLYSVQVQDPREILSNTVLILNNYAGSIFDNTNYINIYGFLEYDVSDSLRDDINNLSIPGYILNGLESPSKWIEPLATSSSFLNIAANLLLQKKELNTIEKRIDLSKTISNNKAISEYAGTDMFRFDLDKASHEQLYWPEFFPMTGEGFSRRCEQGIPWYRVRQALQALFEINGSLPVEYKNKKFGGRINFRGFTYIVDLSGLPLEKIPDMYFLDFDQIDLFSLLQEVCDAISHDLYISLLPVINHPAYYTIAEKNKTLMKDIEDTDDENIKAKLYSDFVVGIIRIDAIDRSSEPSVGVIKKYIDGLSSSGVYVENQDVGYELANVDTDKIVAGSQTADMYFFSNNKDRDNLQLRKYKNGDPDNKLEFLLEQQWLLETSLKQQILPFYGFLGKEVVTIPIGFGSYQQIMLDATSLDAHGVGNYYIATEMELRAALISYEQWSRFLLQYNETYIEELGENQAFWKSLAKNTPENPNPDPIFKIEDLANREFGVSVPRCVFESEQPHMGKDGYPASPCSPPFGYPLYYKRAEKIGIPEAGIANFQSALTQCISNYENIRKAMRDSSDTIEIKYDTLDVALKSSFQAFSKVFGSFEYDADLIKAAINDVGNVFYRLNEINDRLSEIGVSCLIRDTLLSNSDFIKSINHLSRQHEKNARKVYNFVKNIAEKHLGKTFLVKIPKKCNPWFAVNHEVTDPNVFSFKKTPFGFRPMPIYSGVDYTTILDSELADYQDLYNNDSGVFDIALNEIDYPNNGYSYGALKSNFNPISDKWEFNYKPSTNGGFFTYDMFSESLSYSQYGTDLGLLDTVQKELLAPIDLTNLTSDGRISPYVRFDNSQHLDLSNLNKDDFIQQIITNFGYVPDIMEELENTSHDNLISLDQIVKREQYGDTKPKAVTFVKCSVDEQLYTVPRLVQRYVDIYGETYSFETNLQSVSITNYQPDPNSPPNIVMSQPYSMPIFSIGPNGGYDGHRVKIYDFLRKAELDESDPKKDKYIIDTNSKNLDYDHVYAIITLPGRVIPTLDQRYMDGPYQAVNAQSIKHILTEDVVRMTHFQKPTPLIGKEIPLNCDNFSLKQLTDAQKAQKEAISNIGFASANIQIGFTHPSPVYPSLVALPLMSTERCYGPWVSSSILESSASKDRYSSIGGKVSFVKDEKLAPWNFGGYDLMNKAGSLQAEFSNSLLLFSERGGFVMTDIPSNIQLAQPIDKGGPLVTSISVDISDSIKSTIKMDLYTPKFGKLNRQNQDAISRIARDRQEVIDLKNQLSRRSISKSMANNDLLGKVRSQGQSLIDLSEISSQSYSAMQRGQDHPSTILLSVNTKNIDGVLYPPSNTNPQPYTYSQKYVESSMLTTSELQERASIIANNGDPNALHVAYQKTAGQDLANIFTPYSNLPNPYMPSVPPYRNDINLDERRG